MYATASLAERMSGSETISRSGVPARFRSMPLAFARPSCSDLPASSSRCARVTPTVLTSTVIEHDGERPFADDRLLVLADLIALRQIGIEIVLAREDRAARNRCADGESELDRHSHGFRVQHRQHPGVGEIDQTGLACWARRRKRSANPRKSSIWWRAARGSRARSPLPSWPSLVPARSMACAIA